MSLQQITWTPGVSLESLIQQVVEAAFQFYKGNKTATAQSLGVSIRTLDNKLEKYEKEKSQHAKRTEDRQTERQKFIARQRGIPAGAQFDNAASPTAHSPDHYRGVPRSAPAAGKGNGANAESGVRSQPAQDNSEEPAVPVPVRA